MITELDGLIAEATAETHEPVRQALASVQPIFILALPRSHSAVVCAMLGQHPQMYGFPETNLFCAPTMEKWREMCDKSRFHMADGLLRAAGQLLYGEQTEASVKAAEGWLSRRSHFTTSLIFETLAEMTGGLVPVESSSTLVSRPAALLRILQMFPLARFIHVVQHPRGFGEFLMKRIHEAAKQGPVPHWMLNLASLPGVSASDDGTPHREPGFDPQRAWYVLNVNACEFLKQVPDDQKVLLRVEDLSREPLPTFGRIAGWLGLRTDQEAIEAMTHPERSPYACLGPPRARFGNDSSFLQNPEFGLPPTEAQTLDGPLSWSPGAKEFLPKVSELARRFGYQ